MSVRFKSWSVGSFKHFVFFFVSTRTVGIISQRAFQPIYTITGYLSLYTLTNYSLNNCCLFVIVVDRPWGLWIACMIRSQKIYDLIV